MRLRRTVAALAAIALALPLAACGGSSGSSGKSSGKLTFFSWDGQDTMKPLIAKFGHHADVVVGRDENGLEVGWVFYFTHRTVDTLTEHRVDNVVDPQRLTDIHVAVLRAEGDRLSCDRDAPVALDLRRTV
jgi:hypothetical protein